VTARIERLQKELTSWKALTVSTDG
jgi:hypothetical protein